eukprot:3786786-Pyramimonas_sp.AAC.1
MPAAKHRATSAGSDERKGGPKLEPTPKAPPPNARKRSKGPQAAAAAAAKCGGASAPIPQEAVALQSHGARGLRGSSRGWGPPLR